MFTSAKNNEKHAGEGKLEKLTRLNIMENMGEIALAAVGVVLLPPAGAAIAAGVAVGAGVGAIGSKFAHDKLKERRLRKEAR